MFRSLLTLSVVFGTAAVFAETYNQTPLAPTPQTGTSQVTYQTTKEMLEELRGKLETDGLKAAKTDVDKYLAEFGKANETANKLKAEVAAMDTTEIPALVKALEEFKAKEKLYEEGKLEKTAFDPLKEAADKTRDKIAQARKDLLAKQTALVALEQANTTASTNLSAARGKMKDAEDKILTSAAQALGAMTLQQKVDEVKLDGVAVADKINLIEAMLADSVLEEYLKAKLKKSFGTQEFCSGIQACGAFQKKTLDQQAFPGRTKTTH